MEGAVDARAEFFALGQYKGRREEWRSRTERIKKFYNRAWPVCGLTLFHVAHGPTGAFLISGARKGGSSLAGNEGLFD